MCRAAVLLLSTGCVAITSSAYCMATNRARAVTNCFYTFTSAHKLFGFEHFIFSAIGYNLLQQRLFIIGTAVEKHALVYGLYC